MIELNLRAGVAQAHSVTDRYLHVVSADAPFLIRAGDREAFELLRGDSVDLEDFRDFQISSATDNAVVLRSSSLRVRSQTDRVDLDPAASVNLKPGTRIEVSSVQAPGSLTALPTVIFDDSRQKSVGGLNRAELIITAGFDNAGVVWLATDRPGQGIPLEPRGAVALVTQSGFQLYAENLGDRVYLAENK